MYSMHFANENMIATDEGDMVVINGETLPKPPALLNNRGLPKQVVSVMRSPPTFLR